MKYLLILLASLSLAKELSLDELKQSEYECYINYINADFIACDNKIYKNSELVLALKDNIIFVDDFNDDLVIISAKDGKKQINLYKNQQIFNKFINSDINKAFLYKDKIILTTLGSELVFLDLAFNEINRVHFSNASINAASINKQKGKIALGFESGKIVIYDLDKNTFITKEIHKDNIYNIDYKNDKIISCATDRKVVLMNDDLNVLKEIESDNLVYNCAINDDGEYAYSCDIENNICIDKDIINIGNLYLNSIVFNKNTLRLNAYSKILYEKEK